jgi:DNA-binding NarL/FixJ family response regulator
MIRVGILAPALAIRAGLRALLEAVEGLQVLAEGESLAEVGEHAGEVDVLVVAGAAYEEDLKDWIPDLQAGAALFLVDSNAEARELLPGLDSLLWGILPLDSSGEELAAALHALQQGMVVGAPALLQAAFDRSQQRPISLEDTDPLIEPLTEREMDVLELLAQGLANKQIAAALSISENTVKFHVSSIYAKLGAVSRTEAVRIGLRQGLIVL